MISSIKKLLNYWKSGVEFIFCKTTTDIISLLNKNDF